MTSAVLMPFFDIPLVWRVIQRKSSEDISLVWTFGIWICILGMLPSSLLSPDPILKAFGIINTVFFTAVVVAVLLYHPCLRKTDAAKRLPKAPR
jgi:predicted membrane-bound spermidine synthase